jgi:O-antigen ligase
MLSEISGKRNSFLHELRFWLVNAMLATILISALNLNSYCIFAILFLTLIDGNWKQNLIRGFSHPVFISFLVVFIIECAGLLHTGNIKAGLKNIETSAGLIALPFILITGQHFFSRYCRKILRVYCFSLAAVSVYCMITAITEYVNTGATIAFYYHELLKPVNHHAVYFSVFLLTGIAVLFAEIRQYRYDNLKVALRILCIAWFFFFIVLLASKLMLLAGILMIAGLTLLSFKGKKRLIMSAAVIAGMTVAMAIVFSFDNPVRKRFLDMFSGTPALFTQKKFSTDMYFNGLQFRLLNWRFGWEILNENNALPFGVSPGDAQQLLNEKFVQSGMYTGDPQRGDTGLLNYNFHNQFLQTFVESGVAGLLALLFNFALLMLLAFKRKSVNAICMLLLLLVFFLTESVLERQYGVFLYAFFPLFLMTRTLRSLSPPAAT